MKYVTNEKFTFFDYNFKYSYHIKFLFCMEFLVYMVELLEPVT